MELRLSLQSISQRMAKQFRHSYPDPLSRFNAHLIGRISEINRPVILDVGSGKTSCMDLQTKNKYNVCLIGLDISEEELQNNELLDERIISDAQFNLGVPDNSIDIVVSRFVCEHMDNPRNFYKLAYRALKPGGMMMNLIPNPIAPHYMANYLLPHTISKSIVPVLVPGRKYTGVFKTFYKECTPRANERAIRECGDFRTTLYYGDSGAFYMILPPIYLCYLVWGWFWNVLGIRIFNDNFFIVAIKSGGDLG